MKKHLLILISLAFAGLLPLMAQSLQQKAQNLKKPADCGVAAYDAFKNSSFSLKDAVAKSDKSYEAITKEIAKYSSKKKPATAENIKADIAKVNTMKTSLKNYDEKIVDLAESGKKLTTSLGSVKPINKIKSATSNTQKSIKAVDLSRQILTGLSSKTNKDLTLLNGLLAKAGGK
jgi:hypothetical protein